MDPSQVVVQVAVGPAAEQQFSHSLHVGVQIMCGTRCGSWESMEKEAAPYRGLVVSEDSQGCLGHSGFWRAMAFVSVPGGTNSVAFALCFPLKLFGAVHIHSCTP